MLITFQKFGHLTQRGVKNLIVNQFIKVFGGEKSELGIKKISCHAAFDVSFF